MSDKVVGETGPPLITEQSSVYTAESLIAEIFSHRSNHHRLVCFLSIGVFVWCGVLALWGHPYPYPLLTWLSLGWLCCLAIMETTRLFISPIHQYRWLAIQGVITLFSSACLQLGIAVEPWLLGVFTLRLAIDLPPVQAGIGTLVGMLAFSTVSDDNLSSLGLFPQGFDLQRLFQPAPLVLGYLGWILEIRTTEREQAARLLAHHKRTATNLANANIRLQEYTAVVAMASSLEERQRVARDIHDTLGHMLTMLLVQIRACQTALLVRPHDLHDELATAEQAVQSGLRDVRHSVGALRQPRTGRSYGRTHWSKMAHVFGETTGMQIDVEIQEEFSQLDEAIETAVYRVIQEGLTNAYRHGHAPRVRVRVWWSLGYLIIHISDNGRGTDQIHEGNGLRGLRERVEALGGEVAYQYEADSGFDIGVQIPVKGGGWHGRDTVADS